MLKRLRFIFHLVHRGKIKIYVLFTSECIKLLFRLVCYNHVWKCFHNRPSPSVWMSAVDTSVNRKQTSSTCHHHTHMRWVESGVQSGRYLAPMSRAFSLSSPRKGFWKPLRTNTTPSMIFLNGTWGKFSDLAFRCFGFRSGFFSADLWAGEAADKQRLLREKHNRRAKVQV